METTAIYYEDDQNMEYTHCPLKGWTHRNHNSLKTEIADFQVNGQCSCKSYEICYK
jgi:hypothetical protein